MDARVIAEIPYKTIPVIEVGGLPIRTFGLMVAIGVVLGAWFGAAYGEQYGVTRDQAYSLGTRMVLAGVIGARVTWVATHWDTIENPIDVIAVWEGGLQFAGGFIAAIAVGLPTFLKWNRLQRWQLLDGYPVAVLIGAGFGRLGCLAVGEHFGRESSFFLATQWKGAIALPAGEQPLRETTLGLDPGSVIVEPGVSFLNPALYECVTAFLLAGLLWLVLRRKPTPGTVGAMFLFGYSIQRFFYDTLRVNDERFAGMTGAQWMCLAMIPIGFYVLFRVRPAMAAAIAAGEVGGTPVGPTAFAKTGKVPAPRKKGGTAPDDETDVGTGDTEHEVEAAAAPDVDMRDEPSGTAGAVEGTEEAAAVAAEGDQARPSDDAAGASAVADAGALPRRPTARRPERQPGDPAAPAAAPATPTAPTDDHTT